MLFRYVVSVQIPGINPSTIVPSYRYRVPDIEHRMALWTNEQPPGTRTVLLEHGVEPVLVTAGRTYLELVLDLYMGGFVVHGFTFLRNGYLLIPMYS